MDHRYAVFGDVHANLEALNAVIEDARSQQVTDFICLGDVVGYNANPRECIDLIRELGAATVRGNHDHYCAHEEFLDDFQPLAANAISWTRRQLGEDQVEWLRNLPLSRIMHACGLTAVHSTLDMPDHPENLLAQPPEINGLTGTDGTAEAATGACIRNQPGKGVVRQSDRIDGADPQTTSATRAERVIREADAQLRRARLIRLGMGIRGTHDPIGSPLRVRWGRAGCPQAMTRPGMRLLTSACAPMIVPVSICDPSRTDACEPIQTSSSTTMPPLLIIPWRMIGVSGSLKT